ncbi:MAG TPA: cation diffusion facilitator family transporter [Solirubrobacteraceae bacterium]|nr:cation diffusion facilitator family transporter [Solirubrobacteraceae bacterium]
MTSGQDASIASTSRRSMERSRRTAAASRRTVLVALVANAAVAVVKLVAGVLSGSAAMLAEAAHSVADTTNQVFLLVSIGMSAREPTPEQPFGYGRLRFLWTFLAAVTMFLAGAVFAIGYGVYQLLSVGESGDNLAAYVALAVSLGAEGTSWVRAMRQTRSEAAAAKLPLLSYVRHSRDPNVKMVLFEDTAALVGIGLALVGIVLGSVTGSAIPDPAASIAVGLLLVIVASVMAHDTSDLLVGAAARPDERAALEAVLREFREIEHVIELLTMVLGPNSLLVAARVDWADDLEDEDVERVSEAIDQRLRAVVPDVTEVFLDATTSPRWSGRHERDPGPSRA